jgi:two-component system, NtrC family, response regulator AtoC
MSDVAARAAGDSVETQRSGAGVLATARRSLVVMSGADVYVHPLPEAGEVTVGRGSWCNVRIDHPSLSRTHLAFVLGAGIAVVDRGSANGTVVRGTRLDANAQIAIGSNDIVVAGDIALVVQEVGARADAAVRPAAARPSGRIDGAASGPLLLDPAMQRLYEVAARVARGAIGVLIVGETGAGKEVLAEFVHRSSPRAGRPLVRLNCAALTDSLVESELFGHERGAFTGAVRERAGLLETADGGTVMLDEAGELSPSIQAKLLRVIEDRQVMRVGSSRARAVDVRFVAATNRNLEAEVAAGRFRRDLYFRLAGVVLEVPPLRERPVEVEALARAFLAEASARLDGAAPVLAAAAVDALRSHDWPGNVRELRNVIERAVLVQGGGRIEVADLRLSARAEVAPPVVAAVEPAAAGDTSLPDELAEIERRRILDALETCAGNQSRAAVLLGMPRRTFVKRLTRYGIARPRRG